MFRALCAHHQELKIVLYNIWYRQTPVGGRPVHQTATYRVWRYQILYTTIWRPDNEHNSARNM